MMEAISKSIMVLPLSWHFAMCWLIENGIGESVRSRVGVAVVERFCWIWNNCLRLGWLVVGSLSDLRSGLVGSLFLGMGVSMVDFVVVCLFGAVSWAVLTIVALSRLI